MSPDDVIATVPLEAQWPTLDPFLFCVHHLDEYPRGNADMALDPDALRGRDLGMDFSRRDGWSMYHGQAVPGFPRHPHRGFETVTLARRGFVDHSDSLGAAARFGQGDVQWMTAGRGIVHSEMFPLVHADADNPTELFQIWPNLPAEDKLGQPYFTMFWAEDMPRSSALDEQGRRTDIVFVAGPPAGVTPLPPPPTSWASRPEAAVAIWTLAMEPGAEWTLSAAAPDLSRVLYFFAGDRLTVNGREVRSGTGGGQAIQARSDAALHLENGSEPGELLLLQGRPIGEAQARHGPFVMNTDEEIRQAVADYQRTEFGGWPWGSDGPVHPRDEGRFARHVDGRTERPGSDTAGAT